MNIYSASVSLLWTTAMRAAAPRRAAEDVYGAGTAEVVASGRRDREGWGSRASERRPQRTWQSRPR